VTTRKVDDLVRALGADTGISTSEVSGICADLDAEVAALAAVADRSLAEQAVPYLFVDATYRKARVNRRVVSQAVAVATGMAADGHREVLGLTVGDSEDGAFWTAFLRTQRRPGLRGDPTARQTTWGSASEVADRQPLGRWPPGCCASCRRKSRRECQRASYRSPASDASAASDQP
jgi:hypothetical protein